jgi:hypothetical protein
MPALDDKLGGPPQSGIHLMWCGRCGKPFDAGPSEDQTGPAFTRNG